MTRAYARIAFTDTVRQLQQQDDSRRLYAHLDDVPATGDPDRPDVLGQDEATFIAHCDGFYQATVSETGWPYVQYRGGEPGFLTVIDGRTLAYADLRGNRQHISAGNLQRDNRVALFLMDYAAQRRLKIMGRATLVTPELAAQSMPSVRATSTRHRIQRVVRIDLLAYDWNCPQHITPRFTAAQIEQAVRPLHEEIARLRAQLAARGARTPRDRDTREED